MSILGFFGQSTTDDGGFYRDKERIMTANKKGTAEISGILDGEELELWKVLESPIPHAPSQGTIRISEWRHTNFITQEVLPRASTLTPTPDVTKFTELVVLLFGSKKEENALAAKHRGVLPPAVVQMVEDVLFVLKYDRSFVGLLDPEDPAADDPHPLYTDDDEAKDAKEPLWYHLVGDSTVHSLKNQEGIDYYEVNVTDAATPLNVSETTEREELAEHILNRSLEPSDMTISFEIPPSYTPLPPVPVTGSPMPLTANSGKLPIEDAVLQLRDPGYAAMSLLLRKVVIQNHKTKWSAKPAQFLLSQPTPTRYYVGRLYANAFAWLYSEIELYMSRSMWNKIQFAFAQNTELFPWQLEVKQQSLKNINVRLSGGKTLEIYCSACSDDFSTAFTDDSLVEAIYLRKFTDKNWTEANEFQAKAENSGMCVQTLNSKLLGLGLTGKDSEKVSFRQWIGTWQQAQQRLDKFKADAQTLYDRHDGSFTWVRYLNQYFFLMVDVQLKWLADISDEPDDKQIETVDSGWLKWAVKGIAKFGLRAGLLFYKVIEIMIKSPTVVLFVEQAVEAVRKEHCSAATDFIVKARALRSTSLGEIEEYDYDSGAWLQLPEDEKIRILAKDGHIRAEEQQIAADVTNELIEYLPRVCLEKFTGVVAALTGDDGLFKQLLDGILGLLDYIPGGSAVVPALKKVLNGNFFADFVSKAIEGAVAGASKEWRELARQQRNVVRLYHFFTDPFNCTSYTTTLNGRKLGGNAFSALGQNDTRLGVAFQIMMEQAPYIALDLLIQGEGDPETWENAVSDYCARSFVENTRALVGEFSYAELKRHEDEQAAAEESKAEFAQRETTRREELGKEFARAGFALRIQIESKLREKKLWDTPITMAGIGSAVLAKLAEKRELYQRTDDYSKSDGGWTSKSVAAGVGATIGAVSSAAVAKKLNNSTLTVTAKSAAAGALAGATAANLGYDFFNPHGADVVPGTIYDFRQVLSVSYERDLSFRTTLRAFRDEFKGAGAYRPASYAKGMAPKMTKANTLLGYTKSFFLQIPEDNSSINLDRVISYFEMYRLDDRITAALKAEFRVSTLKELVTRRSFVVDGDGTFGLYREAPIEPLVSFSNTTPTQGYTDRTTSV